MTELRPLGLADRQIVCDYLARYPPDISEHTFTNLYVWSKVRPVWYVVHEDTLLFFVNDLDPDNPKKIMFGPPAGLAPLEEILNRYADLLSGAIRIPCSQQQNFAGKGLAAKKDRDNFDYVYSVKDLAELTGRKYAKKRNHVKQCRDTYDCRYEPITTANIAECLDLQDRWCAHRECELNPSLCGEYEAIRETFAHYADFLLIGGAIRIKGTIQAFAIGEGLSRDTAVCHFEKAMPDFNGLGQLVNQWFAQQSLTGFTYVNREQDLGVPGLRQAKKSYHPHHMVEKFTVRLGGCAVRKVENKTYCAQPGI